MANEHDSEIMKILISLSDSGRHREAVSYLFNVAKDIRDDSAYWQAVAGVWTHSGRSDEGLIVWKRLFSAPRRGRHKLMKKGDRRVWRKLPKVVTAYRAVSPWEDPREAMSWTVDPKVAEKFADSWGREVVVRKVRREDVVAYFDRRKEREIIVLASGKLQGEGARR